MGKKHEHIGMRAKRADAFAPVVGYQREVRELRQIADTLANPGRYKRFGAKPPAGLLLDGEPGVGKTLMARCLVDASGLPAFTCRKNKGAKGMAKALRDTFAKAADKAPAIVFLDDMDKLSNSDYELVDTDEYVTVQSCIDEYRGKGVFVLATTNNSGKLPRSLTREGRFDRVMRIEPPTGADAEEIVARYLHGKRCAEGLDAAFIASIVEGHSCAFLETVVNEAALEAAFERAKAIGVRHFVGAYARIEGKGALSLPMPAEAPIVFAGYPSERRQTAFHEAGHVVVSEALSPASVATALLVENRGHIAGFTKERAGAGVSDYRDARHQVLVLLAGSVCVEQKLGMPCIGCHDDFARAASCMRSLLANAALDGMRYSVAEEYCSSEQLSAETEQAVGGALEGCRWEVREILARHDKAVRLVADTLEKQGYILQDDIARAMAA